ncbi:vesicle-associated membrane protein 8-like isoform X2 [Liolophura sinensis]|uniref:vesicle-associated membrane protein 8-like isoform X2 n=1 Tax=Liolophura sinensis TaxID=3198878 RepID=UPI0031597861
MASRDSRSRLDQLDTEVSEVTSLLRNNVEKVMDRGERLDSLQERSEDLHANSVRFNNSSRHLKRKMCCKNVKMTICLIVIVVVVIAAITLIILLSVKPWNHDKPHGNSTVHSPSHRFTVGDSG